ncbi:MAG: hypothetical protein HQL95_00080 [Magnetococcales bacterium]|nr:hypothetical protein [Magnetococcales bacterium]
MTGSDTSQQDSMSRFQLVSVENAAKFSFVMTSTIAAASGLKYYHVYFYYHKIPFLNLNLSLHEILFKASILAFDNIKDLDWKWILISVIVTVLSGFPLLPEIFVKNRGVREIISIIIPCIVLYSWFHVGEIIIKNGEQNALRRYVHEIVLRNTSLPKVVFEGSLEDISGEGGQKVNLKNNCYFLLHQDSTSIYLMLDPVINNKEWEYDIGVSAEDVGRLGERSRKLCEESCNYKDTSECIDEKFEELWSKNRYELYKKKYNDYMTIENDARIIQTKIKITQIPIRNLNYLHISPIGTPLGQGCKTAKRL